MAQAKTERDPEILALAKTLHDAPWCDDYQDMVSGMLYNPNIPQLLEARHQARCKAYKYNNVDPNQFRQDEAAGLRSKLLADLLGRVGTGCVIEPPFRPDYGCNIVIGSDCFFNWGLTILDTSLVIIGDRVQIGTGVSIITAGHETSVLSRIKFVEWGKPIRVEDDCWIGANAVILPGVTIGRGSTIGAGAIVSRDVPPYSVAVGIPARVVKKLPSVEEELADPANLYRNMVDNAFKA
ncbi:putative nodulation protein l [Diaporthe ampelina]|uniref:Putative nodulation protein l n=1 Tax=Diaporthe ampelina TaxID=1214573 RepID=A0A0G2F9G1_9PEZI|nr:putative nodulation protein l [Diaporthe ampelina]